MMGKGLLLTLTLITISWAQGQSSPTNDPTGQAPSTVAPTGPSAAAPEVHPSGAGANQSQTIPVSRDREKGRSFVGTIEKRRHAYVLKAADGEYLLSDHEQAKKYQGKSVRVTGNANKDHVIRVVTIDLSPSW